MSTDKTLAPPTPTGFRCSLRDVAFTPSSSCWSPSKCPELVGPAGVTVELRPHRPAGQWHTLYSHFSGTALATENSGPARSLNKSKLGEQWRRLIRRKILILFLVSPFIIVFIRNNTFSTVNSILRYGKTLWTRGADDIRKQQCSGLA